MNATKKITGKKILIVDDEPDIIDSLTELLDMCKLDTASTFESAKDLLEMNNYDVVILDIMGVNGFELLKITQRRKIPAIMLTAHALSAENLKKSAEDGASYYAPKDEMHKIVLFVEDVIEAKETGKNPWIRGFERLGSLYDLKFGGTDWREKEKQFWKTKLRQIPE